MYSDVEKKLTLQFTLTLASKHEIKILDLDIAITLTFTSNQETLDLALPVTLTLTFPSHQETFYLDIACYPDCYL